MFRLLTTCRSDSDRLVLDDESEEGSEHRFGTIWVLFGPCVDGRAVRRASVRTRPVTFSCTLFLAGVTKTWVCFERSRRS